MTHPELNDIDYFKIDEPTPEQMAKLKAGEIVQLGYTTVYVDDSRQRSDAP